MAVTCFLLIEISYVWSTEDPLKSEVLKLSVSGALGLYSLPDTSRPFRSTLETDFYSNNARFYSKLMHEGNPYVPQPTRITRYFLSIIIS